MMPAAVVIVLTSFHPLLIIRKIYMRINDSLLPYLALATAMTLWASSFIALKIALTAYGPVVMIFGRMLIASALFLAMGKRARTTSYQRGDWKPLLLMAFCEPCLYFVFEGYALQYTSASQAGMVVATLPLFVGVVAFFVLREKLPLSSWAGFVLALGGVVWLSLGGQVTENAPNPILGNTLEALAMVSATGYVVLTKKLTANYSPLFITAVQSWVGAVFFFLLLWLPTTTLPTEFPLLPTLAVVYLGTAVTLGGYGMYNYGVSKLPAGQASAWVNLIPVITLGMGHVVLNDTLTVSQYFASGLVLIGVLLSQKK